jgi:hypothetical protein
MIKVAVFVLGLACVLAQGDPDNQNSQFSQVVDSVTMQLVGNSGQIKLFPTSDSKRFVRIKMSKLEELDTSGQAIGQRSINFASLAEGNKCGDGAGWSNLVKPSGKNFFTSTFTCSAISQGASLATFKLRVS